MSYISIKNKNNTNTNFNANSNFNSYKYNYEKINNKNLNFINYSNILSSELPNILLNSKKKPIEKEINKNKSSVILQYINADYKAADITKFLSFLYSHGGINSELRIVSHNNIMTKLIELLDINNNNIKNIYKTQNLWSMSLSFDDTKKINITRHGFSISNLYKETGETFKQIQYKDPELSLYGILTALVHSNKIRDNEEIYGFKTYPNKIYVSTLIRTWMTAICLYLPYFSELKKKNENENFTLIISPYIKEVDKSKLALFFGLSLDNTPNDFDTQIENILRFLNYVIKMSEFNYSNKDLKKNLTEINKYFQQKNKLIIIYKDKIIKFYMKNSIICKNMDNNNYFKTTINKTKKKITFNNSEIFNGINKPSKETIKKYFIKPCERFSRIYSSDLCTNTLNKLEINENTENNEENYEENNEENMKTRNAITENNNEVKENIKFVLRHSKNNEENMKTRNAITKENKEVNENIKFVLQHLKNKEKINAITEKYVEV